MSDIDDLNTKPAKEATDLLYPDDTNSDGKATLGSPSNPSARADGSHTDTGIKHGAEGDDIAPDAIQTLGQYIGEMTINNVTPLNYDTDTEATPNVNINYSAFQKAFDKDFMAEAAGTLTQTERESLMGTDGAGQLWGQIGDDGVDAALGANWMLRNVVDSGGLEGAAIDPFATIEPATAGDATRVGGAVSAVLKRNRFQQGNPVGLEVEHDFPGLAPTFFNINAPLTREYMLTQRAGGDKATLGRYNATADGISLEDMNDMAQAMLEKATGGSGLGDGALPIKLALGRIDTDDLNPIKNISGNWSDGPTSGYLVNPRRQSYGQLNSPTSKFGGALPTDMIVLAAISALIVIVACLVLCIILDIFALIPGFPPIKYSAEDPGTLPYGQRFGKADFGHDILGAKIYKFLRLPNLSYDYPNFFFKFTVAGATGAIQFFVPQVFGLSAGFFNVVNRNAIRDLEQITNAAEELGNASGFQGIIEAIFMLIDAFTSSATFKLMTTLIALGDTALVATGGLGHSTKSLFAEFYIPWEDSPNRPQMNNIAFRSRLTAGGSKQALAFGTLPRLYNLEMGLAWDPAAADAIPKDAAFLPSDPAFLDFPDTGAIPVGTTAVSNTSKPFVNRFQSFTHGRIPTQMREAMETLLDSYYVPFYFHDLRTNEIVPLHTFVEGISDSFSPEYDQIKGFGRMDPVQIYKGTTRKIGMSFYVVSTNPNDYDDMWFGINRLVAMVYPQWTGGDVRAWQDGTRFKMPFSSVPAASPVIRIRLGELFASNTAPHSVRRLFGFGDQSSFVLGDSFSHEKTGGANKFGIDLADAEEEEKSRIADIVNKMEDSMVGETDLIVDGASEFDAIMVGTTGIANTIFHGVILDNPLKMNFFNRDLSDHGAFHPGTIVVVPGGKSYPGALWNGLQFKRTGRRARFVGDTLMEVCGYACIPLSVKMDATGYSPAIRAKGRRNLYYVLRPWNESWVVDDAFNQPKFPKKIVGICVPVGKVTMDRTDTCRNYYAMASAPPIPLPMAPTEDDPSPEELADELFFAVGSNSITKGFREAGGGGLAGVITNMDMDWNLAPWATEQAQGRAPMYVKISIGFAPIHDIPPGLGEDGTMRAPVYPVGNVVRDRFGDRFGVPGVPSPRESAMQEALAAKAAFDKAMAPDEGPPDDLD